MVHKPVGMTSHDVVDAVRRIWGQQAVGHAGTLDPLASGLLVLVLGNATKVVKYLMDTSKTYVAEVHLGYTSTTFDAEGVDLSQPQQPMGQLDTEDIRNVLKSFQGTITQVVPPHSAVHVDGKRLYRRTRAGEDIDRPDREVTVHSIEMLSHVTDKLQVRVICGKGTYIRSLANDIGECLGCGGYLSLLVREGSGKFSLSDAATLEQLERLAKDGRLQEQLIEIGDALDLGAISVSPVAAKGVLNGRAPIGEDVVQVHGLFMTGETILVKDESSRVLAIGKSLIDSELIGERTNDPVLTFDRVLS